MLKAAAAKLRNRMTSFEVFGGRDGRWIIEGVLDTEDEAIGFARSLLNSGKWDEVKVVRQRSLITGSTSETVVFQERKPVAKEKPVHVTGTAAGVGNCAAIDDLYTFEARMIIGRLLRLFLDKFKITATELLHSYGYMRKVSDAGTLISAALHQVAKVQVQGADIPVKKRMAELELLLDQTLKRARDLHAARSKLPKLDPANITATSERVRATLPEELHDYVVLSLLTEHLIGGGSVGGKQEALLAMITDTLDDRLVRLLEGFVADTLCTAESIKDLLGPQRNLGTSLCTLADFLHGRILDDGVKISPSLVRIGELMRAGKAPHCRVVLIERLRQAINQDQPLEPRDLNTDAALLRDLTDRLKDSKGQFLGGSVVEQALTSRSIRNRQAMLRAQGMHDIADALPKHYQPTLS